MIKDPVLAKQLQEDWAVTIRFREKIKSLTSGSMMSGISSAPLKLADIAHNTTLLFAFSVLQDSLRQLKNEDVFSAKYDTLGCLMHSSKGKLNWIDFKEMDRGRVKRNDMAHHLKFLSRGFCWAYIDGIERELVAWKVIP